MVRKGSHTEEVLDQVLLDRSRFDIPKGDNWGKNFAKTEVLHYICESVCGIRRFRLKLACDLTEYRHDHQQRFGRASRTRSVRHPTLLFPSIAL